jgi:RNA polymerase sigma factor (TIGR02999 family)
MDQPAGPGDITGLLRSWSGGNADSLAKLTDLVYPELRRIAAGYLRQENPGHILQPTALVNEAYLRFSSIREMDFADRKHFFALAARLMRQILTDHARKVNAARRGGGASLVQLEHHPGLAGSDGLRTVEMILLDGALDDLAAFDERKARLVELRYFGGMSVYEAGEYLGVSPATVSREQRVAEAWLARRMSERSSQSPG